MRRRVPIELADLRRGVLMVQAFFFQEVDERLTDRALFAGLRALDPGAALVAHVSFA